MVLHWVVVEFVVVLFGWLVRVLKVNVNVIDRKGTFICEEMYWVVRCES